MNISQYGASFYEEPWRAQYRAPGFQAGHWTVREGIGRGSLNLSSSCSLEDHSSLISCVSGVMTQPVAQGLFGRAFCRAQGPNCWLWIWLKIIDIHRPQMARFDAEVVRIEAVKAATSRNQTWQWKNHPAIINHIDFIEDARMPNNGSWRHVWLLEGNQPWHLK